jgi:hypothetical protein
MIVCKRALDRRHHTVEVGVDVPVPESKRAKAGSAEDRIPHGVVIGLRGIGMLTPIDLDYEAAPETDEVEIEA